MYLRLTKYHTMKIYPSLKHYAMKMDGGMEVSLHAFFNLGTIKYLDIVFRAVKYGQGESPFPSF